MTTTRNEQKPRAGKVVLSIWTEKALVDAIDCMLADIEATMGYKLSRSQWMKKVLTDKLNELQEAA